MEEAKLTEIEFELVDAIFVLLQGQRSLNAVLIIDELLCQWVIPIVRALECNAIKVESDKHGGFFNHLVLLHALNHIGTSFRWRVGGGHFAQEFSCVLVLATLVGDCQCK